MAGVAANPPSPEGWQQAKPLIERLYVKEDRPLKEVRAHMAEHRSFLATERMFKQRLKEWGFDRKKVKAAEWRYMLQLTRQRRSHGKDSAFWVNGKVIVWSNIRKHLKRKKRTEDEFLSENPHVETVDDILCYTPPGSPHLSLNQPLASPPLTSPLHQSPYLPARVVSLPADHYLACSSKSSVGVEPGLQILSEPGSSISFVGSKAPECAVTAVTMDTETPLSRLSLSTAHPLTAAQISKDLFRPLNSRASEPVDQATGLKMSLMMSGLYYQSGPPVPTATLSVQLNESAEGCYVHSSDDDTQADSSLSPPTSDFVSINEKRIPFDDDLAARWVGHYFLACVCHSQGDEKGVQQGMAQASQVFRSMLTQFNPHLLTGLTLMASILYFHGRVELLKKFLQQSCDIIEELFCKDHPLIVPYRYMLGCVGHADADTLVSNEFLRRAWEQFQLTWRSVHPNTLTTRYYYGCSLLDGGHLVKAEEELRGCFNVANCSIGHCHILTVWSLATLSRVLSNCGEHRQREAVNCLESAIQRCGKIMHEEHPYYLELHRYLADLYQKLNDLEQAEYYYRIVLNGRIKVLGMEGESTRAAVVSLADVLVARKREHEALELRARYLNA